jgi:hypothetical protein
VPTRLLDWTDTLGYAACFALDGLKEGDEPAIWVLNPHSLNEVWAKSEGEGPYPRDVIPPENLGQFGNILRVQDGDWPGWTTPVAIYPQQINERVRAQRGWYTIHGRTREPLEAQVPSAVECIVLNSDCVGELRTILEFMGITTASLYPDLDHLAAEITRKNRGWISTRRKQQGSSG